MDWSKKEMDIISRAADIFDLPADVIGSLPHLELIGDCQMLLGSHQGFSPTAERRSTSTAAG